MNEIEELEELEKTIRDLTIKINKLKNIIEQNKKSGKPKEEYDTLENGLEIMRKAFNDAEESYSNVKSQLRDETIDCILS